MKRHPIALAAMLTALALPTAAADIASEPSPTELRAMERQRVGIYKAWFPDLATARKAAISFHNQLIEAEYDKGYLVMELAGDEIAALQRFGMRIEPAPEVIARRDALLDAIDALAADAGIFAIPGFNCYETVEETFAAAKAMATARPTLARWLDIGDSWQKTKRRATGYDMRVLVLGNNALPGTKPKLFVNAAMHAREYVTAPVALAFARWLFDGYGNNADATWLMDHHEVHLLLHTNPDGRKMAEAGAMWRKNTNTAYCGPRSSSRGADLNRNFAFSWNTTNGQGSSGSPCAETFRGPVASSEPETQAAQNYMRSLWPDKRGPAPDDAAPADTSGVHLDLHSYGQLVLWPWGETGTPSPNASALQTMGRRLAWFNNYTPMQSIGLYPTDGTSDGPSYGELGVASFTIEMGTTFFQSCSSYTATILPQNLPALIYAAKVARAPYQLPGGPDVTALSVAGGVPPGTPVALTAAITSTRFNQGNGNEPVPAIAGAEAYIDLPPWAPGAVALPLAAQDGAFNSPTEAATTTLATAGLAPGRHLVYVRGFAADGKFGPVTAVFLDLSVQ